MIVLTNQDNSYIMRASRLMTVVLAFCLLQLTYGEPANPPRHFFSPNQSEFTATLILHWPAAYCQLLSADSTTTCRPQQLALWDSLSFTLGGLRLSSRTPNHYNDFDWHEMNFNKAVLDRLSNYWPNLHGLHQEENKNRSEGGYSLWEYEWNTYGKDYAHLIQSLYSEELSQGRSSLQSFYFDDVLKIYERRFYDAKKIVKSSILHPQDIFLLEKRQIANLLRLEETQFILKCLPQSNRLYEIQICLKFDEDGAAEVGCGQVEKEASSLLADSCPEEVELYRYNTNGDTDSERVTSYGKEEL